MNKFSGKNIDDVLKMTVEEALVFFENVPKVKAKLEIMSLVNIVKIIIYLLIIFNY